MKTLLIATLAAISGFLLGRVFAQEEARLPNFPETYDWAGW